MKITDNEQVIEERCERLRTVRNKLLRIPRSRLAKKYGIALSSLQAWEDPQYGGLTENGAYRILSVLQEEGIEISLEWLMYGLGEPPKGLTSPFTLTAKKETLTENERIAQELKLFHQLYANAVHMVIQDDALLPLLNEGDYVAGAWIFGEDIKQVINKICIVQLSVGTLLTRVVNPGEKNHHYTLRGTNPNTTNEHLFENVKLMGAAPIIWIRKFAFLSGSSGF